MCNLYSEFTIVIDLSTVYISFPILIMQCQILHKQYHSLANESIGLYTSLLYRMEHSQTRLSYHTEDLLF